MLASMADHQLRRPSQAVCGLLLLLVIAAGSPVARADGDPAVAVQRTPLRESPAAQAPRSGRSLAKDESVRVLELSGRWAQVRQDDGFQGWVPAADLKLGDAAPTGGGVGQAAGSWLRSITGLLSPREQEPVTQGTVGLGIRGLDKSDIAQAKPDPAAVDRMSRFQAGPEAAREHARRQGLAPRALDYVPDAASPAGASGDEGGGSNR